MLRRYSNYLLNKENHVLSWKIILMQKLKAVSGPCHWAVPQAFYNEVHYEDSDNATLSLCALA